MAVDKFEFNKEELAVVNDKEFLALKNSIIENIVSLFSRLEKALRNEWHDEYLELPKTGKITRGEKYKQLPYVVLDFPASFTKTDILAYRSIFWWGNYFSNQFILRGSYLNASKSKLIENFKLLKKSGVFLDISADPWNHDVNVETVKPIKEITVEKYSEYVMNNPFYKLIWCISLEDANKFISFSSDNMNIVKSLIFLDS